jgi:hypothetical protein
LRKVKIFEILFNLNKCIGEENAEHFRGLGHEGDDCGDGEVDRPWVSA